MAEWKVSVERIKVFPHPKADRMDCARVGLYQLVVGKTNGYADGDLVVFAPKRSVLPEEIRKDYLSADTGESYLKEGGRVDSKWLRGELSEGVTLSRAWVTSKLGVELGDIPEGEDISGRLGITLFEYPVPAELSGKVVKMPTTSYAQHDVEGFTIFADSFVEGEQVIATEKMNGSQVAVMAGTDGTITISTKLLFAKGLAYAPDADVLFTRAVRLAKLDDQLRAAFPGEFVQVFAEVVPVSGGGSHGFTADKPGLFLYRLDVDGRRLGRREAMAALPDQRWVPVLYEGPLDPEKLRKLSKGKETVSGRAIHIREGIVVEPVEPRASKQGFPLLLKVINPEFRDDDASPS